MQATVCTKDDDELAGALYTVVLKLSRLPADEPVDKAGLAVLHETRRLGTFRPSDLAAEMRLDVSTISRHLRSLEQQGLVQRSADPDDARCPADQHYRARRLRPKPSDGSPCRNDPRRYRPLAGG